MQLEHTLPDLPTPHRGSCASKPKGAAPMSSIIDRLKGPQPRPISERMAEAYEKCLPLYLDLEHGLYLEPDLRRPTKELTAQVAALLDGILGGDDAEIGTIAGYDVTVTRKDDGGYRLADVVPMMTDPLFDLTAAVVHALAGHQPQPTRRWSVEEFRRAFTRVQQLRSPERRERTITWLHDRLRAPWGAEGAATDALAQEMVAAAAALRTEPQQQAGDEHIEDGFA
jgi:hypothetical protein